MTDSIEDWDSLWERMEKYVDIDEITDKEMFKQSMINAFFKDSTSGYSGSHEAIIDELWDRGVDKGTFVEVEEVSGAELEVPEEEPEIERTIKSYDEQRDWTNKYVHGEITWEQFIHKIFLGA